MTTVRAAAIYARISADHEGAALGVARQLDDCRRTAREMGWVVAEEYVDNDVSASSGRPRPAYERLLADVRGGRRDAVLAYHSDRLHRRPIEAERFLEAMDHASVRHLRFVAGADVDIANGDGLLVFRVMGAVAANESATKSRRVRRKMDEVAAAGRPHGGANRPFGYDDDKVTVRASEAEIIRQLTARFLAGESVRSLAQWLSDHDVPTVNGVEWRTSTVRAILTSARIAGLRTHRGEVIGPAMWEPIITDTDRAKILARFDQLASSGRRSPRSYLLTGLLRCGKCGGVLFSQAREATRRYVCVSGPDHRGCGGITVVAGPLEEVVADAVLYRLDTPAMADALAGRTGQDEYAAALAESIAADRRQLDELARLHGEREITQREWMAAKAPVQDRIRDAESKLGRMSNSDALAGVIGNGGELRREWATLNLTRQHAIVRAVLDHAVVNPATPGVQAFDPDRVDLVWRL
jgi:site-specific DNA recombinase